MRLEMMTAADVESRLRMETDPVMMAELGGPRPPEAERMFGRIHAFPAVPNGPSNRICEKNGFVNLGECDYSFGGRVFRCNHWRIDLF